MDDIQRYMEEEKQRDEIAIQRPPRDTEPKVTITLGEYTALRQASTDMERILGAITRDLSLYKNYNGQMELDFSGKNTFNLMQALYNDYLDGVFADLLDAYNKEEEEEEKE